MAWFNIFYSVNLCGRKTEFYSWPRAPCHFMELLSACAISLPPPLTRVHLDAHWRVVKHAFAQTWQKRTDMTIRYPFYYTLLFPCHIYTPFLKDSALCSCFFCWFFFFKYINIYIVHHLHCCEESVSRFDFCSREGSGSFSWWPGKWALLLHPTLHALSLCHMISQMHIRDDMLLLGPKEF